MSAPIAPREIQDYAKRAEIYGYNQDMESKTTSGIVTKEDKATGAL